MFEIPPFCNSQFSGGNTRKLRVFFLNTNAALEVKNRVQFAWAKYESLALGCVTLQRGGGDAHAYGLGMPYFNPTKPQEPRQRQER